MLASSPSGTWRVQRHERIILACASVCTDPLAGTRRARAA